MRHFAFIVLLLSCFAASAADRITATISVTNAPLGNTNTLAVNGSTRTFTNTVTASPATLIQQTNSIPWSATNILNQITDYRFSQFHFLSQTASTNFLIVGAVGEALTVTLAGGWGKVVYSTQTVSSPTFIVRVPMTVEQTSNRTHIASLLVKGQSDNSTNSFATNAVAMSNYVSRGASPQQQVASPMHFAGLVRAGAGVALTNGFTSALTNINSVSSNHINFGNAIRSEGPGGNSLQVGSNALALSLRSIAIGNGSVATNTDSVAIGSGAAATNTSSLAIGNSAIATGNSSAAIGNASKATNDSSVAVGNAAYAYGNGSTAVGAGALAQYANGSAFGQDSLATAVQGTAIGNSASASGGRSTSVGYGASAGHTNSSAFGQFATTTTTNEVVLGTASEVVHIPGRMESVVSTNGTFKGTNIFNSQVVFTPNANTGLANGYNAAVAIGAAYVRFSGPTAAYTNAGFSAANKMDGKMHFLQFDNPGLSMTFLHDSGLDPGNSTNRIYTGTGALVNSTNRVVHVIMSYDDAVTAWRIWSFR